MKNFQVGVNLGGWLSQYQAYDHAHFQTFITEADIKQIASWGVDHVRLPFDYPVLESDEAPGRYREDGFRYLDDCLTWCEQAGLNVVLDLHHAPGYTFTNTLQPETEHLNVLFKETAAQQRFIALWEAIVQRYRSAGDRVAFELLNEVVLPSSDPWNQLAEQTITALRKLTAEQAIIIGGNNYNDVTELKNLVLVDDPHVYYTFHFYRPMPFTHQKAPWTASISAYDQTVEYPGEFPRLAEFAATHEDFDRFYGWLAAETNNRELLRRFLQPAYDFMQAHKRPLYCGEFGVIDRAPMASAIRWQTDFIDLLREAGIGRAVWSYKQMDFGLVDGDGRVVDEELVRVISQA